MHGVEGSISEHRRLQRLHRLRVLDTAAEPAMDALTDLAAAATGMPIALICLIDDKRQWWKSAVGLPQGAGTSRETSFCTHAIAGDGVLEIADARRDARFAGNPLVVGGPRVVHYAGAPLVMPGGEKIGTLCVLDHQPGQLDARSRLLLGKLADSTVNLLLLRESEHELDGRLHAEALVQQELEASNRRKDEFLAMLGHELRNPLAPISSAAEVLRLAADDPGVVRESSELIARQVKHMTGLIDDLLDVSRVTRGLVDIAHDVLDINHVVRSALEQSTPQIDARGHHCSLRLHPAPVHVRGDHRRLVQVVTNLLNNAAKFTPPGGNIAVGVTVTDGLVTVSVEDDGTGIAPELLPHVFGLFTQAQRSLDRSQGGLGLGLALVKSLVDLHGGNVQATSDGPGQGTRVAVALPRVASDPLPPGLLAAALPAAKSRPMRVVVVDDNVDGGQMLGSWLKLQGHRVAVLTSSQAALDRLARGEPADIYILDIGLPEMNGYELARRLRKTPEGERALVIAVTGYGQPGNVEAAREAGFDCHFVKPVDLAALSTVLARAPLRPEL